MTKFSEAEIKIDTWKYNFERGEFRIILAPTGDTLAIRLKHDYDYDEEEERISQLYDTKTGKAKWEKPIKGYPCEGSFFFSPDGRFFIVGTEYTHRLLLFDTKTDTFEPKNIIKNIIKKEKGFIRKSFFSPNGRFLVLLMRMKNFVRLLLFDTKSEKLTLKNSIKTLEADHATFSPKSNLLAIGSSSYPAASGALFVIGKNGKIKKTIPLKNNNYVTFSNNNRFMAIHFKNNTLQILDLKTGKPLKNWEKPIETSCNLYLNKDKFSPDSKYFATMNRNKYGTGGSLQLYDTATGKPILKYPINTFKFEFSPDSKFLAAINTFRNVQILDTETGNIKTIVNIYNGFKFSPDGEHFATSNRYPKKNIQLFDTKYSQAKYETSNSISYSNSWFKFSPLPPTPEASADLRRQAYAFAKASSHRQGKYLAIFSGMPFFTFDSVPKLFNGFIQLVDTKTGKLLWEINKKKMGIRDLIFSPNSKFLAIQSNHNRDRHLDQLQIFDTKTGKPVWDTPIKNVFFFDFYKTSKTTKLLVLEKYRKKFIIKQYQEDPDSLERQEYLIQAPDAKKIIKIKTEAHTIEVPVALIGIESKSPMVQNTLTT